MSLRHLKYKENTQHTAVLSGRTAGIDDIYIHKYYAQRINTHMKSWTEMLCARSSLIHRLLNYTD